MFYSLQDFRTIVFRLWVGAWPTELVLWIVLLLQVQDDRSTENARGTNDLSEKGDPKSIPVGESIPFKDREVVVVRVDQSWNATIRVDLQEPILFLFVTFKIDSLVVVLEVRINRTQLLQEVGHLLAIWCGDRVQFERLHDSVNL